MLLTQTYLIDCEIYPKGRPRFTRSGHAYTPSRTRKNEDEIREHLIRQQKYPIIAKGTACRVDVVFYFQRPRTDKKCKRDFCLTTTDLDNLIKQVLDASIEILFDDDKSIVEMRAAKQYSTSSFCILMLTPLESGDRLSLPL